MNTPIPHSDEISWDPRDFDERTGYADMEGPGAGWCICMLVIPVVGVIVAYFLGW